MKTIDINCDVGEGVADEQLIMPYISSCSIACGGHFGDKNTIDKTIQSALKNNVLMGAHPSFPDPANFGRKAMAISPLELQKSIESQVDLLVSRLAVFKAEMHHIKPHGALYNLIAIDEGFANSFVKSIEKYRKNIFLYVPYDSVIERIAIENKIKIKYEVFVDRNYNDDLTLVSRTLKNALITAPQKVFEHVLSMIKNKRVLTVTNVAIAIKADTFCVHGDNKHALDILKEVTQLLKAQNIQIV